MDTIPESMEVREELHRGIVSRSPHPIFLVETGRGACLDCNDATLRLLGYDRSEFAQLHLNDIDLTGHEEPLQLFERVRRFHHDILGERTFRQRDGRTVPVEVSANLVIYQGVEALCFFARDITERVEASREQERLGRALSLSQKHEAVGRLAAGIAHDFNNQLMVIQLCAQMVGSRLDETDPNQQEIRDLLGASRSATALIRQLLAFSGKQLLNPSRVDIDEVIAQEENMLRRALGEDIRIEARYGAQSARVFFDRTQLEQVVLNLAVNARDAMPAGGTFSIETSVVDVTDDFVEDFVTLSSGPHVLIKVSDTGIGMDEDTLGRIFEPFFTTKQSGKGTGLGLATVYGIVKQSGGSVWASSRPGSGTTFRVYLPMATGAEEPVPPTASPPERPDLPGGDETVLIVDDDEMVRALAGRTIRELGYRVLEAAHPEEAIELFAKGLEDPDSSIDLILSDVLMPGRSGPEMIREIEQYSDRLRVVFMSGYAEGRIRVEDLRTKNFIFLEKPLGRSDLAHAIRTSLDR